MKQPLEWILDRRSIRKYKTDPIEPAVLEQVLEAGFQAPSAMNRQPWHFVVVDDREILGKFMELHPYTKFFDKVPCAIVVCGDTEISDTFYIDDCAAATQNILLAAHALGLGSCWCGLEHTDRAQSFGELLGLPKTVHAYSLIALGYPDEEKPRPQRVKPERIHRNRF